MVDFKKRQGGDLYISTAKNPMVTDPTATNAEDVIAEFEAISFDNMGVLNAFSIEHLMENENTNYAMNCSIAGAFLKTADVSWNINSAIYSVNIDLLAKLTDYFRQDILGTPVVGEVFDYEIGSAYATAFALPKSNSSLYSAYSLVSLIEDVTAYTLIENTDYSVSVIDGVAYVTFINSGNYDITANKVVATYDYTPKTEKVMQGKAANIEVPFYSYKFVGCSYQAEVDGVVGTYQDIYYFTSTTLSGSVLETYLNTGENLEGSDIALKGEQGGVILKREIKLA